MEGPSSRDDEPSRHEPGARSSGHESKKKTFHASERDTRRVARLRWTYRRKVANLDPAKLVFVDESGSNTGMAREYARAPVGRRAHASKPARWGDNITMLGAVRRRGFAAMMTINAPTSGEVFLAYVRHILAPALRPDDVVLMDNLGAHKVRGVREMIEAVGAKLIYLPPYSPDLNPIEPCWSKVKNLLRAAEARTRDALDTALARAMDAVTPSECRAIFRHCGYAT